MPLHIVRNDITKMDTDAIVNAANNSLLGGGGVDGAIHRAAGPDLLEECRALGGCDTGFAKITKGYELPCKYVIHTVGPIWQGGDFGEKTLLESCYKKSLELAKEYNCESVAFPLISAGVYGYPKDKALKIAIDCISEFLFDNEMTVYIVIFDSASYDIGSKLFSDINAYIDDNYTLSYEKEKRVRFFENVLPIAPSMGKVCAGKAICDEEIEFVCDESIDSVSLSEAVSHLDESFSEMLLRKIDEKGISDAQCYKKANIDRKLFSKIRSNPDYRPSKSTALAFAIALELDIEEVRDMLMKAGFALSHSNKFDIIVEYFIINNNYDIFEINEALFAFDQKLLGA